MLRFVAVPIYPFPLCLFPFSGPETGVWDIYLQGGMKTRGCDWVRGGGAHWTRPNYTESFLLATLLLRLPPCRVHQELKRKRGKENGDSYVVCTLILERTLNPILHKWFRDSYKNIGWVFNHTVFPLIFKIGNDNLTILASLPRGEGTEMLPCKKK